MAEGGLRLVDGSQISDSLDTLDNRAARLFEGLEAGDDGCVSAAQCQAAASSEITNLLAGIQLPTRRFDHALKASEFPIDSFRVDRPTFVSRLRSLLKCTADALHDEPLVVSILDGAVIKSLVEDEDDFAMLAENLFTELDVDDRGKITPDKLHAALLRMGLEMGVPVPSAKPDAEDLISSSLAKYTNDGDQEIGQARFAELLQGILEDIAGSLASHPMTITLNVKVNNGNQIRKLLEDDELLSKFADGMYEEVDINKNGKLDRAEFRVFLECRGTEWGLPSKESSELVGQMYDDLFSISDTDSSGEIDKEEFQVLLLEIFKSFAVQLEFNPIFTPMDTDTS